MADTTENFNPDSDLITSEDTAPRFLKGTCKLGIVYAPDGGALGGYQARTRIQPDPNKMLPENFYIDQDENEISPRLTGVTQAGGGLLPTVNSDIGAPLCTFNLFGITPGKVSRWFDLIKGPELPLDITLPEFSGQANAGGVATGTSRPVDYSDSRFLPATSKPFIPPTSNIGGVSGAPILTTYNIWQILNLSADETKNAVYYEDRGATVGVTGKRLIQQAQGGIMQVSVHAVNNYAVVERVYPISHDMAYQEGAKLYFPFVSQGISIPPQAIEARGGENCGFQLHITPAELGRSTNPNLQNSESNIVIVWGDNLDGSAEGANTSSKTINYFSLQLSASEPKLSYYDPVSGQYITRVLSTSDQGRLRYQNTTHVYVHFVGPQMLIGFSEDVSTWSCLSGFEKGQDYKTLYIPRISDQAKIRMLATNIHYTFTYGPMTFNSFNPEQIHSISQSSYSRTQSHCNVKFAAPQSKPESVNETSINKQFQEHRCISREKIGSSDFDASTYEPMYYGDWRRQDGGDMSYKELSSNYVKTTDIAVTGRVTWNTTIEGPMFVHIRNISAKEATTPPPLVYPLSWGDLSSHLEYFDVSVNFENDNRSLLVSTATVKLANLASNPVKDEVLARLRENILVVTLTAGYDVQGTYFQGIVDDVEEIYDASGSTTTLKCIDILNGILSDTPVRATMQFRTMRYGKIIYDMIQMSGLANWFRPSISDALVSALNVRLGNQPSGSTLANHILMADPTMDILSLLKEALALVIDTKSTLPVLWWEPSEGYLRLDGRSDLDIETLYFAGDDSSGITLSPNNFTTREHGLLVDGYSMSTSVKQLHAGLRLFGKSFTGKTLLYERDFTGANDATGLNAILQDVSKVAAGIGWVGWKKILVYRKQRDQLADQLAINLYGRSLENYLRTPYQSIGFKVYVTRPLIHAGRFRISTFNGLGVPDELGLFYYQQVNYTYNKEENIMTASITGEKFPSLIADVSPAQPPLSTVSG